jgi:hypothetical protein
MSKKQDPALFLILDTELPNHTVELAKADEIIKNLKVKLKQLIITKKLDGNTHTLLYEEIIRILDYVGRLSIPLFEIEEKMVEQYILKYPKSPQLAKKLCNDHYEQLHYPYTILKNRCFKLLEDLDNAFRKHWKKNPPNWNI